MSAETPTTGQPEAPLPLLRDRFELGERISDGPIFVAHRGRDISTGRPVLIQILKLEFAEETLVTRLLSEAQAAIRLEHPNVAQTLDAWKERGTVVVVGEMIRGINLKDRIKRVAPFPLQVCLDILLACADALNYAHRSGFVHGDLRPEHVLISPDGQVRVGHFGIGTALAGSTRLLLNALPQAVHYQSPEVAQGKAPDARSDIYALGCILHEMLSGRVLFEADSPVAVAAQHLHVAPPALRTVNPDVPRAVEGLALKCLQKDQRSRYLTLESMLQDLHSIRESLKNGRSLDWSPLEGGASPRMEPPLIKERPKPPPKAVPAPAPSRPVTAPASAPVYQDSGPHWGLLVGLAVLILAMVGAGFGMVFVLTSTPNQVPMPMLVRQAEETAVSQLKSLGMKVDVQRQFKEDFAPGMVFDTDPKAGVEMRTGKSVKLYVSQGGEPVVVPDVVGQKHDQAVKIIQGAGLSLGAREEKFSEIIEKGEVITQSPAAGEVTGKKGKIDLIVSKGPEPVKESEIIDVQPTETVTPEPTTPSDPPPTRQFSVSFPIPADAEGAQKVRIEVVNEDGSVEQQYEQEHFPGDQVSEVVTIVAREGKGRLRVYLNGRKIEDQRR